MSKTLSKSELTKEKFANFLNWLSPNKELASEEYERLRFRLMTYFSHRKCQFAEELVDETINRVVIKIGEEVIKNKLAYCYGVAKFVFLESIRNEQKHKNIDDLQIAFDEEESEDNAENCLDKCLGKLPQVKRDLVLNYFSESKQEKIDLHKNMSDELNISKTALRMKILRIKKRLKNCLEDCLAD